MSDTDTDSECDCGFCHLIDTNTQICGMRVRLLPKKTGHMNSGSLTQEQIDSVIAIVCKARDENKPKVGGQCGADQNTYSLHIFRFTKYEYVVCFHTKSKFESPAADQTEHDDPKPI